MSRRSLSRFAVLSIAAVWPLQAFQPTVKADDPFGASPKSQQSSGNQDPFASDLSSSNDNSPGNPYGALTKTPRKSNVPKLPVFSEAREAAALVFVKQNCPELIKSLDEYRKLNVPGYHQAIRQFFQWSEMSTEGTFKDKDGLRLALKGSQATIESQLLSAKLMSDPTQIDNLKSDLTRLIENSVDFQIAQAEHQIAKVESQLAAMRSQLDEVTSKRDETIATRLASLEKMVAQQINLSNVPDLVKVAIQKLQEAASLKAAEGHDVSNISKGMQRIEVLIREGRNEQALLALQKGLEYLNRQK